MDVESALKKLQSASAVVVDKLREVTTFAGEVAGGTHRVAPRVELDRYQELCSELEYALEAHAQARDAFLRAIRGDG